MVVIHEEPNHLPFVDSVLAAMQPGQHMSRLEIHQLACKLANRNPGSGTGATWTRIHFRVTDDPALSYLYNATKDGTPLRVVKLLPA